MSDPTRERQIVEAIKAILVSAPQISGVGNNVFRGRVYTAEREELPCIGIYGGEDLPLGEFGPQVSGRYDWRLAVTTEFSVTASTEEELENEMFRIRGAIFGKLMAKGQLDLPDFVIQIWPGPAQAPELTEEQQQPTGKRSLIWFVHYVTSELDLGA